MDSCSGSRSDIMNVVIVQRSLIYCCGCCFIMCSISETIHHGLGPGCGLCTLGTISCNWGTFDKLAYAIRAAVSSKVAALLCLWLPWTAVVRPSLPLVTAVAVCPVTDISATVAPIGVKFCMMVHIGPIHQVSPFGGLTTPSDPKNLKCWLCKNKYMENGKWQRYMSIKHYKGFLKMSLGRASGGVHPHMAVFYYYYLIIIVRSTVPAVRLKQRKKWFADFIETWCFDCAYQSDELIKFWWASGPGYGFRIMFPFPSPLWNTWF